MVSLKHCSDKMRFDVFVRQTFIGFILSTSDKTWIFKPDLPTIPDDVLSEVRAILHTLNL